MAPDASLGHSKQQLKQAALPGQILHKGVPLGQRGDEAQHRMGDGPMPGSCQFKDRV